MKNKQQNMDKGSSNKKVYSLAPTTTNIRPKLKETIQFMGSYYDGGLFTIDLDELVDWINQNYISKKQILNLECLKEEKTESEDTWVCPECSCYGVENGYCCFDGKKLVNKNHIWESDRDLIRNQLRKQIKEAVNKL